jgi:hypothetical protein
MTKNLKKQSAPADTRALRSPGKRQQNNQGDYTANLGLEQRHYDMLKASAIADDVIRERGYRTIMEAKDLKALGFSESQLRAPGLLLPLHSTDGDIPLYIYRPDSPRVLEDKKHRNEDGTYKQKVIKYEMPRGEKMRLDVPPRCRGDLDDPAIPLWITEGQKKADALASLGLCAVALLGVWNFMGTNEKGGKTVISEFRFHIALNNARPVRIVFDSDVMTKPEVKQALDTLIQFMQKKGAKVEAVYLLGGSNKTGVDDWLSAGHTLEELEDLVEGPRPEIKVAPPVVELLDSAPLTIRRPLCLVAGKAYAAIWPYVLTRTTQKLINGQVIQLKEPEEIREQSLHIVRNDGRMFGPVESPLSTLGIDVSLPEPPPAKESLWSTPGVKAYVGGYRPDPADVFERVKSVIARFIDFDRSLADQQTMSEMLACFAISSWFLDAFSVAPYIWANGERGSGKTSLLLILVRLSYLGESLSPSGSSAAIRDLADYGATLGLDDAEDLTDPKKSDPDKRTILLSGNRKGVTVPLKQEKPGGGWMLRQVNCYCSRIFSTIKKPDPTLSSRALIIPVVRTAQRSKGNADPLDDAQWPCNRQKLIDDLWAMSLFYLPDMPAFDKLIGEKSKLIGRDLQPWRAILSVAAWLDSMGVSNLWKKIEALAAGTYQDERVDLEMVDINRIAMRALGEYVAQTPSKTEWSFSTQTIMEIMHRLIDDEEIEIDKDIIKTQMLGHRFKKMRLPKDENTRPRLWKISKHALETMFAAYRIPIPEEFAGKIDSGLGDIGEIGYIGVIGDNPSNLANVANVELGGNTPILPQNPCLACGSVAWYIGTGGNVLCGICHPDPRTANVSKVSLGTSQG